jgi:Cu+-exporting ATPase
MGQELFPVVSAAHVGVRAELIAPAAITPGAPVRVAYRLTDARTAAPITDVIVSHDAPAHLIAVRSDLTRFQHVHPQPTGLPGEYSLDITFPEAGTYLLFAEFARATRQNLLLQDTLVVGAPSAGAELTPDRAPKVVSGDLRIALQGAGAVMAGRQATLAFRVEDPRTGDGVGDLQPYLGAPAHVVIMGADGRTFAHTHGEPAGAGPAAGHAEAGKGKAGEGAHADTPGATYGPEIAFHHTFPQPGLYKVWAQFRNHHGQVVTVDYAIRVT